MKSLEEITWWWSDRKEPRSFFVSDIKVSAAVFREAFIRGLKQMVIKASANICGAFEKYRAEVFVGRDNKEVRVIGKGVQQPFLNGSQVTPESTFLEHWAESLHEFRDASVDFVWDLVKIRARPVRTADVQLTRGPLVGGVESFMAEGDFG